MNLTTKKIKGKDYRVTKLSTLYLTYSRITMQGKDRTDKSEYNVRASGQTYGTAIIIEKHNLKD